MTDTTYNGWKNYETWGVALLLDNYEETYNEVRERIANIEQESRLDDRVIDEIWTVEQATRYNAADWLKDYTETLCGIGSESEDLGIAEPTMMARQLLGAAISNVDWDEIASHYLEEER